MIMVKSSKMFAEGEKTDSVKEQSAKIRITKMYLKLTYKNFLITVKTKNILKTKYHFHTYWYIRWRSLTHVSRIIPLILAKLY